MRVPRAARSLLLALALCSGLSFAGRPPKEFNAPDELTPEQIAAQKQQALGGNLNGYDNVEEKVKPVPWMMIGITVILFAIFTPLGMKYFRETADEMAPGGKPVRGAPRKKAVAAAEVDGETRIKKM